MVADVGWVRTVSAAIHEFGQVCAELSHSDEVCLDKSGRDILVELTVLLRVDHPVRDLLHHALAHFPDALQNGHVGGDVEGIGVFVQPLENLMARMESER